MGVGADDFVGRVDHLRDVARLLGDVVRGRGGLVVVTGEAGIGKTRLCEQMTERAREQGVQVAWAACWESSPVAPLWPWGQLLRQLVADRPVLLDGLSDRVQWLDMVMGRAAQSATDDPDMARIELAATVLDFLRAAGRDCPGLLVLDDLHWADTPSLRVLAAVAPVLRSMPVVMAVTYRDADVGEALAGLRPQLLRHGTVLALEGLTPGEVAELMAGITGATPDAALVDVLYEHAGGNPLFTRELVRFGVDVSGALPPTIGATLGARMCRLSACCRRVLTVAAVVGDEFTLDVVALAEGLTRAEVLVAVDQAAAARLVRVGGGPGRFRFTHALARAAALERLGLAQRIGLHGSVGDALEQLRGRGHHVETAALAHHFAAAASAGRSAKAVAYCVEAAVEAGRRTAYEEAARLFRQAVGVVDLDPDAADRGELLLALADAEQAAGEAAAARQAFLDAASLARATGRPALLARAALGVGGRGGFEVTLADREQIDLLEQALTAIGPDEPGLRAQLCGRLSIALTYGYGHGRRRALADEAVALARASGDDDALAWAVAAYCDCISGPGYLGAREEAAAEVITLGQRRGDRRLELLGRRLRAMALLERGDTAGFDAEVDTYESLAATLRQPLYLWFVPLWRAMRLAMAGEFDLSEVQRQRAVELGEQAASGNATLLCLVQRWCTLADQGRGDDALDALDEIDAKGLESTTLLVSRALTLAVAGRYDEARAVTDRIAGRLKEVPVDAEWLPLLCQVALISEGIGGHRVAAWACEKLLPYRDQFVVEGIGAWCRGSAEEFLGLLALAMSRPTDADRHFAAAVAANGAAGASFAARRAGERRATQPPPAVFRRTGDVWELAWSGTEVRIGDRKGLHDLARLLSAPGREIAAVDLAGASVVDHSGEAVLDATARDAYAAQLRDLEADLDESDRHGDAARSARLAAERHALVEQLTAAYGLGGRARRLGPSTAERARSTVTQRIRDALRHVEASHPDLAAHLRASIRTGAFCTYVPGQPVTWQL